MSYKIHSDQVDFGTGSLNLSASYALTSSYAMNSSNVTYTNLTPTLISVGGIQTGSTFEDKTMQEMWDALLQPELFPTLTAPSLTSFTLAQSGYREIGELVSVLSFTSSFSRGTISPAYGTSGLRSGLPTSYNYTGTGLPASVTTSSLSLRTAATNYTVGIGVQSWTNSVSYNIGEQPLSSKGNNYSTPLPAGTTSATTVNITGVYPYYATTIAIDVLTKQALTSMASSYVGMTMIAEDDTNKQTIDFPTVWSSITGIQFYNTVSSTWEWINGSKANSLLTFTITSTTHDIQGNTINYNRYTHNGSKIGSRQLRFYTT